MKYVSECVFIQYYIYLSTIYKILELRLKSGVALRQNKNHVFGDSGSKLTSLSTSNVSRLYYIVTAVKWNDRCLTIGFMETCPWVKHGSSIIICLLMRHNTNGRDSGHGSMSKQARALNTRSIVTKNLYF